MIGRARGAGQLGALLLLTALAPARPAAAQAFGAAPPAARAVARALAPGRSLAVSLTAPTAFAPGPPPPAAAAPAARGFVSDLARALGLASPDSFLVQGYREQLGAGFGGRAGYVVASRLYMGATYAVRGAPLVLGLETPASQAREGVAYVGPEFGIDLRSGPVRLRPYLATGLGLALARALGPGPNAPRGAGGVIAWPGLSVSYLVRHVALGADLRPAAALMPGGLPNVCAFATFGVQL